MYGRFSEVTIKPFDFINSSFQLIKTVVFWGNVPVSLAQKENYGIHTNPIYPQAFLSPANYRCFGTQARPRLAPDYRHFNIAFLPHRHVV